MIHPNERARLTAEMRNLLLQFLDVDTVLDRCAERFGITKKLAAELIPKDTSPASKEVLSLFIAAEITTHMERGRTTEDAVRMGFQRFDVTPPRETFLNMVRMFEGERHRLAGLRPGEIDNGVGGVMKIVDTSGNPIRVGPKPS